jgi:hypothetical protein
MYCRLGCRLTWFIAQTLQDEIIGDGGGLLRSVAMHIDESSARSRLVFVSREKFGIQKNSKLFFFR